MADQQATQSSSDTTLVIALVVLTIAMVYFTISAPFILILSWFYYKSRTSEFPPFKSISDFVFTPTEAMHLNALTFKIVLLEKHRDKLIEKGKDLSRRADGYFNERSNLGKELNAELIPLKAELKSREIQHKQLEALPIMRCDKYLQLIGMRKGLFFSMIAYAVLLITFIAKKPETVVSLSSFLNKHNYFGVPFGVTHAYGSMLAALIVSGVILLISYIVAKGSLAKAMESADKLSSDDARKCNNRLVKLISIGLRDDKDDGDDAPAQAALVQEEPKQMMPQQAAVSPEKTVNPGPSVPLKEEIRNTMLPKKLHIVTKIAIGIFVLFFALIFALIAYVKIGK